MAPMFRITGAICVLIMVPLVIGQNITYNMSFAGDVFLLIYIMFFGCLGMALGAGNSGHPYAVIAVSRGLAQMSSYELSFSIADGIGLGFICYILIKLISGKARECSIAAYVIAAIFALKYAFL